MTAPARPSPRDTLLQASADMMRITISELRAWEAEAARRIVMPKTDEEAWEGSELDAARTAL